MRNWQNRVRTAFVSAAHRPADDIVEELAQHARATYEAARADGCSAEEADARVSELLDRWQADADALKHRSRAEAAIPAPPGGSASPFAGFVQDVHYAARLLRRQPRHALITIVTMALGIGATTVLFGVTYGVLMRPLPWPNADRVVVLKETRGGIAPRFGAFTNAAYVAWLSDARTIEKLAAWSQRVVTLSGTGDPERIRITAASASLFPTLGLRPVIGTLFDEQDETSPVVVLSEALWRERFGSDPAVLGRLVHLDGEVFTVVGVLPDAESFPDRQARAIVPHAVRPGAGNSLSMFNAIAALRPGVTAAQAASEGTARGRFVADTGLTTTAIFGGNGPVEVTAQPLRDALTMDVRQPLIVLLAAVGLLLATATANVASLQLARTTTRSREMAIRAALGAGGPRVTRQLLVESLLLGLTGGAAGLALTWILQRSLPTLLPADFPRVDDLGVDTVVVLFAGVVSVGSAVLFGLLPALRASRIDLVEALAENATAPVGTGLRTRNARARLAIMTGQVAIACVLLVGASLLVRSFVALLNADRGYETSGVLSARLSMPASMFPSPERRLAILERVLTRLAAMPGVTTVAFTSELPLTPGGSTSAFTFKSPVANGAMVNVQASPRIVSAHYFSALGMRMIAGRPFTDADTETTERGVVVNQAFARRYLGDSPLGWRVPVAGYGSRDGRQLQATVIGVVGDVRYVTAADISQPEMYFSYRQMDGGLPVQTITLLARTSKTTAVDTATLRTVVREADDRLVAEAMMPLEQRMRTTLARPRLYAVLLAGFAGFALVIAGVGLFGVLSYSVSQRSRELAIRAALGARSMDIFSIVLQQGLVVTLAGLAAGLAASTWLTRPLVTQLYGITQHDTLTFVLVPIVILVAAAVACVIPARRAARLDPLRVLRGG
jgi:putative ABC transport system permease protein